MVYYVGVHIEFNYQSIEYTINFKVVCLKLSLCQYVTYMYKIHVYLPTL